jgi:hypothetical protein
MFYIIVILAGILAMPAQAQSLRDQLVGAWTLVSCSAPTPLCRNINRILILDASGHYAAINAPRGRAKVSGDPPGTSPAEEIKALQPGFVANFGTWLVPLNH